MASEIKEIIKYPEVYCLICLFLYYTIHHGQLENLRPPYFVCFVYENYSSSKYKDDGLNLSNISLAQQAKQRSLTEIL